MLSFPFYHADDNNEDGQFWILTEIDASEIEDPSKKYIASSCWLIDTIKTSKPLGAMKKENFSETLHIARTLSRWYGNFSDGVENFHGLHAPTFIVHSKLKSEFAN